MTNDAGTALERQIRSQPDAIEHMLSSPAVRQQVHMATEGLHRARRLWVIGTGTSLHAAELGAAMLMEAGRAATVVPAMQFVTTATVIGPKDGVIVITHTGETSYALAARALAFTGGLDTVTITKRGTDFSRSIETVDAETSETYTVSYTSALIALALIAQELGAESLSHDALAAVPDAVRAAIEDPGVDTIPRPQRALVLAGAGPAAITAREGALKIREAARVLAEGVGHTSLREPAAMSALLAQIPLTVRLQMMALRMAREGGQDPDTVIVRAWADEAMWRTGAPEE
jgi:glucosamine--fructose-6-phosphate aminotransferase (isomerizing)